MIEAFFYEARPFLYLSAAFGAHKTYPSTSMDACSVLLAGCVALILFWRYEYRYVRNHR